MKQNKIYSLLGLATRSRNVVSGEFMTEKAVKGGSAFLVIVGADASDNTKKQFHNMCEFYHVPIYCFGTKEELGHAMGKEMRASLAVTDAGFSKSLIKLLEESNR
ncbi:MAG: ribosomal L7Ae/L30e/S12e/Gadd45 family protein [Lachnospiraceae bacterium]|nr:ribosomal L7Ae/L30e/S12e/Gadd45 family protein [Lachnospiraceae bacterium]